MRQRAFGCGSPFVFALFLFGALGACSDDDVSLDDRLGELVAGLELAPIDAAPAANAAKVALGQALFFDKELGGNRDMACASCHHPDFGTGDELPVAIGVGGTNGLGPERALGADREFVPRNSPELFNRGDEAWRTMFWDSRVSGTPYDGFTTPAGGALLEGLDSALAAQAMFPVTSRDEMRGLAGDKDATGADNELGALDDTDTLGIWTALMARVRAIDGYVTMFAAAYPSVETEDLTFAHAANAIAAFEVDAFTFTDAPWDRYLRGEIDAMTEAQKRGAVLFFGDAGCASCHSGKLLTDQEAHSICAPQIGPGKGAGAPLDLGRFLESGEAVDRYAFRTPPLRNVTLTGPWMHAGAYVDLEDAVRHHLDPITALKQYDPTQLREDLRDTFDGDEAIMADMLATLDALVAEPLRLDDDEVSDLMAFLAALTDPAAEDLSDTIPASVPSGLPVD